MRLRVLGCSGSIGAGHRTTALLVNEHILVDAGTGVGDLTMEELIGIRQVFLTHAHLDHIACLPLLLDSVGERRGAPLQVFALPDVLYALREHIFNGVIWPDFTRIPSRTAPWLSLLPLPEEGKKDIGGGGALQVLPVNHTVPAVAYALISPDNTWVFSGDTGNSPVFWSALNALPRLDALIMECAFPDREHALARLSAHFCPSMLAEGLATLQHQPALYLTHLKPACEQETLTDVAHVLAPWSPVCLREGAVFDF